MNPAAPVTRILKRVLRIDRHTDAAMNRAPSSHPVSAHSSNEVDTGIYATILTASSCAESIEASILGPVSTGNWSMNVEVTFELLRPHECQRQTGLSGSTGSPTDERCLGRSHCPMRGSPDYVRAIVERALGTQQFVGAGLIFHSGRGPSMQGHAGRTTSARTEIRPRRIRGASESFHREMRNHPTCSAFV